MRHHPAPAARDRSTDSSHSSPDLDFHEQRLRTDCPPPRCLPEPVAPARRGNCRTLRNHKTPTQQATSAGGMPDRHGVHRKQAVQKENGSILVTEAAGQLGPIWHGLLLGRALPIRAMPPRRRLGRGIAGRWSRSSETCSNRPASIASSAAAGIRFLPHDGRFRQTSSPKKIFGAASPRSGVRVPRTSS
jgi:hypothetical protein